MLFGLLSGLPASKACAGDRGVPWWREDEHSSAARLSADHDTHVCMSDVGIGGWTAAGQWPLSIAKLVGSFASLCLVREEVGVSCWPSWCWYI